MDALQTQIMEWLAIQTGRTAHFDALIAFLPQGEHATSERERTTHPDIDAALAALVASGTITFDGDVIAAT